MGRKWQINRKEGADAIAIVIVSHSKQLALGVQELAAQMVQGKVTLAIAAGIDDAENPLGTDPILVYQAIAGLRD